MRHLTRHLAPLASPSVGYISAVLGVIGVASITFFNLQGMTAKAHRHWDADIDRIIATQQAKKHDLLARADGRDDARPQMATLVSRSADEGQGFDDDLSWNDDPNASNVAGGELTPQKIQTGRKGKARTERRRQHFIPAAFATLPKFARTAASTTTTLLRLR